MRGLPVLLLAGLILSLGSCGSNVTTTTAQTATDLFSQQSGSGLSAFPTDGVQPWETLDSRGYVTPGKGSSAFPAGSEFTPGVERFSDGGSVSVNGDALLLQPASGSGTLSYAVYRFVMGGQQPGAFAVDANLGNPAGSDTYWVGISDYGSNRWQWHGPFADAQTAVVLGSGDYLSTLGNCFVAVAAYDGAVANIVGVLLSPRDSGDTTAPPVPGGLTLTPVNSGLELNWNDAIAADLAGYQIYWSYSPFTAPTDNGVNAQPTLENTTRSVLPLPWNRDVFVALSAVDVHGNASELSSPERHRKLDGAAAVSLVLSVSTTSAQRNDPATLNATGADLYDFDLDGDGVFDITGNASGVAAVDTSATGIIRPRVRGSSSDGTAVAFGSVSLIVSGNQRPVANAQCSPQHGVAPLNVTMNGTGEDFDGSIAEYAWDFDGDGIYDHNSGVDGLTAETFTVPGLYNAKLRVTDNLGAWDVDTVAVFVTPAGSGADPPEAVLNADPPEGDPGVTIQLDGSASSADGLIVKYEFDLDGNGSYELDNGAVATTLKVFATPGHYSVGLRVTDNAVPAQTASTTLSITIDGWAAPMIPNAIQSLHLGPLLIIDGHPAMAVYGSSMLQFIRALDRDGTQWGAPVIVDNSAGVIGWDPSMTIVNGNPALAYYDPTNMVLKYCRASSRDGSTWGSKVTVDATPNRGYHPELLVVNGRPAICYFHNGAGDLYYVRASGTNGGTWGAPVQVEGMVNQVHTQHRSSMALINGFPAIAYHGDTDDDLRYVRATDANGSGWGASLQLDGGGGMIAGHYPSLRVIAGAPAVSYLYPASQDLHYIRATDVNGEAWGPFVNVQTTDAIGFYSSLNVVNGIPAIAYRNGSTGKLMYVEAADAAGLVWTTHPPLILDGNGDTGEHIGFAIIDGTPAISYIDTAFNLHYIRNY